MSLTKHIQESVREFEEKLNVLDSGFPEYAVDKEKVKALLISPQLSLLEKVVEEVEKKKGKWVKITR